MKIYRKIGTQGPYVLYSDHLQEVEVLREALKEALDGLVKAKPFGGPHLERVRELRKLLGTFEPTS